jgi:dipeptidyl aminopeptidase/acylaminoacyl peptidase
MEQLPALPDATSVLVQGDGVLLGGYLFSPPMTLTASPAVLLLHGHGGDALDMAEPARQLSQAGYAALSLSMRGWRGSSGLDDCGLRQATDTVKAIEWLADQDQLDSERIGIVGSSQGGQVALLAGAQSPRLKAIVAHKPVTDIDRWQATTDHPDIPTYISSICCPESRLRSPVDFASTIVAPVLLIHGAADWRVPTEQSILMKEALIAANKHVELRLIEGAAHSARSFGPEGIKTLWALTSEFLDRFLKPL